MHEIPHIITERVDDIPLWLEHRQRRGLPTLCDDHCPTPGHWQGLSLGWVSPIGLSSMVSRRDPRLVPVAPWVAKRLWTRGATTGQAVQRGDGPAERLAIVLRCWRDARPWAACASALHPPTGRGDDRATARGPVESPSARASATVTEGGRCPCGHRPASRPALPPRHVRQAVLAPWGRPVAPAGGSGERAAAPLAVPGRERGPAR